MNSTVLLITPPFTRQNTLYPATSYSKGFLEVILLSKKELLKIAIVSLFLSPILNTRSFAQTLPVGTPLLEETWRRKQIMGERDINTSFTIRPIVGYTNQDYDSLYYPGEMIEAKRRIDSLSFFKRSGMARLRPATLQQQYNVDHPYGWNDGSMIPARGYQFRASAGIFAKWHFMSVQLQPEFVYAQNKNFNTFPTVYSDSVWAGYYHILNRIDNPEKFGNGSYAKFFWGQSSIRANYKKLSFGLSTENLWWGPGVRNALVMSNNAPGFAHITFNSMAPVKSPIGTFEWQIVSGSLKSSGILPPDTGRTFNGQKLYQPKPNGNRYFNGMVVTWQPKWTKGLHLGLTRAFYQYESDRANTFDGYLPVLGAFFKQNTPNEDRKRRDELLSVFMRLILPNEKAELYAEYGRNDHARNGKDLLLEPEHARAYTIGFRKLFETKKKTLFELFLEVTQTENSPTLLVRAQEGWYTHYQVRDGYTNLGQVIGAGIGPGGNSQTFGINWIKGIRKLGFSLERVVYNNDFYYSTIGVPMKGVSAHWVDISLNANKTWYHKRVIYSANMSFIRSLNYHWNYLSDPALLKSNPKDVSNFQASLSLGYLF